jgi:diketogulonate reductase-like aldo/keto reductase
MRWSVQHGNVVLPKSSNPSLIAESASIFCFTLDERAMADLDALEEGLVTGRDPADQR